MIYTGNYFNDATKTMRRIRISLSMPKGFDANETWMAVAPKWDLLGPYKDGAIDDDEYTRRYRAMLDANADAVIERYRQLERRFRDSDAVLLCWCRAGAFCHRRLLAEWLGEHGFPVPPELPSAAPKASRRRDDGPTLF